MLIDGVFAARRDQEKIEGNVAKEESGMVKCKFCTQPGDNLGAQGSHYEDKER